MTQTRLENDTFRESFHRAPRAAGAGARGNPGMEGIPNSAKPGRLRFRAWAALSLLALGVGAVQAQEPAQTEKAPDPFPRVRVETTAGAFTLELFAMDAPLTVAQFLRLTGSRFYEGSIFHRVVKDFVIQGGGWSVDFQERAIDESLPNESGNGRSNLRGTIAMARVEDPHSAKNQFYINLQDNAALNPRPGRWGYAVFGRVISGMDVVDEIGNRVTGPGGPFDQDVPAAPVIIERVLRVAE